MDHRNNTYADWVGSERLAAGEDADLGTVPAAELGARRPVSVFRHAVEVENNDNVGESLETVKGGGQIIAENYIRAHIFPTADSRLPDPITDDAYSPIEHRVTPDQRSRTTQQGAQAICDRHKLKYNSGPRARFIQAPTLGTQMNRYVLN
jgi:hypothetical protein